MLISALGNRNGINGGVIVLGAYLVLMGAYLILMGA